VKNILAIIFVAFSIQSCISPPSDDNTPTSSGGTSTPVSLCKQVPDLSTMTLTNAACTSLSGQWTVYDFTSIGSSKSYEMFCGGTSDEHYTSQAGFDAGTNVDGTSIVSNTDFIREESCASGSVTFNDSSGKIRTLIWVEQK